jgi:hypothetical protein
MYGEIPLAKGEDDANIFSSFLMESRLPAEAKSVSWEVIRDVLQVYKVRAFCLLVAIILKETTSASLFHFI